MPATISGHWETAAARSVLRGLPARISAAQRSAVLETGENIARMARNNFEGSHRPGQRHVGGNKPNVVTGRLRGSIHATPVRLVTGWASIVSASAPYGRFVENGTRRSRAFPFMRPAFIHGASLFRSTMAENLLAAL